MTASAGAGEGGGIALWAAASALALAAHLGFAALVLARGPETAEGTPSNAITVDLTPEPAPANQSETAPGPPAPEAVAPTEEVAETPSSEPPAEAAPPPAPEPAAVEPAPETPEPPPPAETAVVLPRAQKPQQPKKPEVKPPRPVTRASAAAAQTAAAGGGRPSAARIATWTSELALRLAARKRYPADAQARQEQGVALLRFSVDGNGRVVSRALVKSSGAASLDQESLSLVHRAEPFPAPPPGVRLPVEISVPVRFSYQ